MTELFQKILKGPTSNYLKKLTATQLSTLNEFEEYNKYQNFKYHTRVSQLQLIGRLGVETRIEFQDMTKEDIVNWLKNKDIKPYS